MCGIGGIFLKNGSDRTYIENVVDILEQNIEHRGPDALGSHIEDNQGFLNRRLAIVGIEGGNQPIYTDDGRYGVVYNGEVYNYQDLREKLIKQGVSFHTETDTEVVLKHFVKHGPEGLKDFEGMFGICFWDVKDQMAYIVRDGFGMKPMYLYEDDDQLIFSSELSALIKVPGLNLQLNPAGINDYLTFRYVTAPYTIFKNIKRLHPGTYLTVQNGNIKEYPFKDILDIEPKEMISSFDEGKIKLHDALLASLHKHLISEVPIALLLSGGVDSSILAALLHELDTDMTCYNIGFDSVNEFEYSSAIADKYGFKLHNVEITADDIHNNFEDIILALDEPIADPACFPLHLLCKEIKKSATVLLSGEGADELFAGYPQYRDFTSKMSMTERVPSFLSNSYYFLDNTDTFKEKELRGGWRRTIKYYKGQQSFDAMSNYDFKTWVPDNLMMKADKIAMRSSLEGRFPFLDYSLLELSRSLPDEFLLSETGETKYILKETFADKLPEIILKRPKMGFTVPVSDLVIAFKHMYLNSLEVLKNHQIAQIVDFDVLKDHLDQFINGQTDLALKVWTSFVLFTWLADRSSTH